MKCPFCDTEMRHGYFICGAAIWSEHKHFMTITPAPREDCPLELESPMLSPHHLESDYCPNCEHIVINASAYSRRAEQKNAERTKTWIK